LISNLEISLTEAIFGGKRQLMSFDGSLKSIEIRPGTQSSDKVIFKNLV